MTDDLANLIEAIRGTKAKVAFYLEPGRDYRKGLQEIGDIVEDRLVQEALRAVSHVAQQPGLVVDHLRRRVSGCANAETRANLVAWHQIR
jgi:hypothetical protein